MAFFDGPAWSQPPDSALREGQRRLAASKDEFGYNRPGDIGHPMSIATLMMGGAASAATGGGGSGGAAGDGGGFFSKLFSGGGGGKARGFGQFMKMLPQGME